MFSLSSLNQGPFALGSFPHIGQPATDPIAGTTKVPQNLVGVILKNNGKTENPFRDEVTDCAHAFKTEVQTPANIDRGKLARKSVSYIDYFQFFFGHRSSLKGEYRGGFYEDNFGLDSDGPLEQSLKTEIQNAFDGTPTEITYSIGDGWMTFEHPESGLQAKLALFKEKVTNSDGSVQDVIQPVLFFEGLNEFQAGRNTWNCILNITGKVPPNMKAAIKLAGVVKGFFKDKAKTIPSGDNRSSQTFMPIKTGGYSMGGGLAAVAGAYHDIDNFSVNGMPLGKGALAIVDEAARRFGHKPEQLKSVALTEKGDWVADGMWMRFVRWLVGLFTATPTKRGVEVFLPKGGHCRPEIKGPGLLCPVEPHENRITENELIAKHQNVQSISTCIAMLLANLDAYKNAGKHPVDILAGKMDRQI
ncbi:MAG: hypothetical protein JWQ00_1511 [Noviherbaspirillum sp.]|nr:hypothetical protein [Noviherbaspirillum sp.]